jgi:hypothetical protein
VFAGAAREAVFSNPEVIRRVNADFVPVALKAALVNNPTDDEEGRLYQEIGRSKPAPQGICVANSQGKVLAWALMFDDDKSVLSFFDYTLKRNTQFPGAKQPVPAERFMRFPSAKLDDIPDAGKITPVPERHPRGKDCPAKARFPRGTVTARVFGRALGEDGKPVTDTVRQEHYVEDRLQVTLPMQETLAKALADAGTNRVRIDDDLARLLVSHAYLGQLDVNPVGAPGGKSGLKKWEFWAQKVNASGKAPPSVSPPKLGGRHRGGWVRVEGRSEAAGASHDGEGGDGRLWQHEVKLAWDGLIEIEQGRITRLLLIANGTEKLKWGNQNQELKGQVDAAHLPAGHFIDLACGVRFGIMGESVPDEEAGTSVTSGPPVPDEARRQITEALGVPFMVFRDKVQKELKVSDDQKQKLDDRLQDQFQEAMQLFQKLGGLKPEDREKELNSYRGKAQEKLAAFLKETLKADQLARLRQLQLQQEGLFALGHPEIGQKLQITDEQRKQFVALVQEMQGKIQPLIEEAESKGNPQEIRPKAMKFRQDYGRKIEAVLNKTQKRLWNEMLGKPFELDD